jgi:chemotaxis protein MotC
MKLRAALATFTVVLWLHPAQGMEASAPAETPSQAITDSHSKDAVSKSETSIKIEKLFLLQDESARGAFDSLPAQKALLIEIGGELAEYPLDDADHLAFHAAAYVLSGGNPDVVDRLSHADGMPATKKKLLEASTTFMRGDRDAARKLLAALELSELPPFLSGRLALARAVTAEPQSASQQDDLAFAMASMPGTLVEESALRRSALAYAEARNENFFFQRLARYSRRFPSSIYADSFWSDVTRLLATWDLKDPELSFSSFSAVMLTADETRRKKNYLELARMAAISGKRVLMERAAEELQKLADPGSTEESISSLYKNLYVVATTQDTNALKAIDAIPEDALDLTERSLRDAARNLGRSLLKPLKPPGDIGHMEPSETTPLMERANTLLTESDDVLSRVRS